MNRVLTTDRELFGAARRNPKMTIGTTPTSVREAALLYCDDDGHCTESAVAGWPEAARRTVAGLLEALREAEAALRPADCAFVSDAEAMRRIRAAMSATPYSATETCRRAAGQAGEMTLHNVAGWIEALRDVLCAAGERERRMEGELGDIRAELAALGRLLGRIRAAGDGISP